MLLEAPIASTLIMLAAPTLLVNIAQSAVGVIETYFIGRLGADALAGLALVFPVVMLAQMMSAGAVGGGIEGHVPYDSQPMLHLLRTSGHPVQVRWDGGDVLSVELEVGQPPAIAGTG